MLYNVGPRIVRSKNGLISTVAYKLGPNESPVYALEGSVAMAGGIVSWLKDHLNIFDKPKDIEILASKCNDTGDVYFVPAFSGLFAPYWRYLRNYFTKIFFILLYLILLTFLTGLMPGD